MLHAKTNKNKQEQSRTNGSYRNKQHLRDKVAAKRERKTVGKGINGI